MSQHWGWALLLGCLAMLWPGGAAYAYHNADFATPVVRGGGNGMYFTGSPRYKRYDCTVCHLGSAGVVGVELTSDPAELLAEQRYTPGQLYRLTITMTGEHLGDTNKDNGYNHNSFVAEFNDDGGALVGGFDADPLDGVFTMDVAGGDPRIVAGYWGDGSSSWSLDFRAPDAGSGRATLYLAAVDGNAAGGNIATVVDPFGDDVFVGAWRFCEAGSSCDVSFAEVDVDEGVASPHGHGNCSVAQVGGVSAAYGSNKFGWSLCLTLLGALLLHRRRRLFHRGLLFHRGRLLHVSRRLLLHASGRAWGLGLVAALLGGAALGCEHPELPDECADGLCDYSGEGESVGTSPALDLAAFRCETQPVLQARCAFFPCHGDDERPFVVYAPNRLRLDTEDTETVMATTPAELQANYDAAIAFSRDDTPNASYLLQKPLDAVAGGYYHFGESLYYQSDVFVSEDDIGYQRILGWIGGGTLSADCLPTQEVGP